MTFPAAGAAPTPIAPTGGAASLTGPQASSPMFLEVNSDSPPPMKTLVYSPDIRVLIAHNNKQYDVSADVTAFSIRRCENSVSSFVFKCGNKKDGAKLRYMQVFDAMDKVTIFLKRVEWIQVITGYLDSAPLVQLYGGTVNFRGSCTLKRLVHTYWDPGLPAAQEIFNQMGTMNSVQEPAGGELLADSGLGSLVRRALVKVGGWDPGQIHIQRFPMGYYFFMQEMLARYGKPQATGDAFRRLLLGDDTSAGTGAAAGRELGVTRGAYVLTQPERMQEVIRAVDEMGMGPDNMSTGLGQGIQTAATQSSDHRDKPAWQTSGEVGKNFSDAAMKSDAAVHCFMVIAVESQWIMWANASDPESLTFPHDKVGQDHDSIGLYQQRSQGWGTVAQRMNPRESTMMFLKRLQGMDWRNMNRGEACANVQNPRSDLRGLYALQESAAIEQVRAIRSGTGSTPSGQQNVGVGSGGLNTGLGATSLTSIPSPPVTTGIPGLGSGVGSSLTIPTSNGIPSVTAAAGTVPGTPQYNTAGALSCARAQIGKPYLWGATGPASFDCSGLMHYAYRSIGLDIGRDTGAERATLQHINPSQLVPGDLVQPNDGHVVMWTGNGTIVEAPEPGKTVREGPIYFNIANATCLHVPGTEYGGVPFAPFDPVSPGPGAMPGTVAAGQYGGTAQIGSNEPIARNLFTYQFNPTTHFVNYVSMLYGSGQNGSPPEAAFMNDEPLLHTIVSFVKAGLRSFASAPNGDFLAYYPDYFGLDGKQAVFHLEDIEMKNVGIDKNDDALATHVYVAGSAIPTGGSMGVLGWLTTRGIATVENEWIYRMAQQVAPQVPGSVVTSGAEMMRKYGVRPLSQEMPNLQSGPMELLTAIAIFMEKWAQQYATQVELTFMPELFPGMRLNLGDHHLQVYVTEVVHAGDFESGFTTTATIMAPSNPVIANLANQVLGGVGVQNRALIDLIGKASTWMSG